MKREKIIRSVNWHVTMNCNYNCRFCFYKNTKGEFIDLDKAENKLKKLRSIGIDKINITGGEPLLYKKLNSLLKMAKSAGFTVSIVTNGSLLNEINISEMAEIVDWIGISVDSADERIESELGRGCGNHIENVKHVSKLINGYGIKLKINTTVTKLNYNEKLTDLVEYLAPERWKVFQVLQLKGQNDDALDLSITTEEFENFKKINGDLILKNGTKPIFESNTDMLDSYFIIGPDGNIILSQNYERSVLPFESINNINLSEIVNLENYSKRGAIYDWCDDQYHKKRT